MSDASRCPTCRAPFRGAAACARCGTDLLPAMRVLAAAHALREKARLALLAGSSPEEVLRTASQAHRLQATERSAALLVLSACRAGRRAEALAALESSAGDERPKGASRAGEA